MITELGHFALVLAFLVAIFQSVVPLVGAHKRWPGWMAVAEPAATTQFLLAPLLWSFWAVPLGIQPPRAGRSRAIIVSVFLSALFYYLMVLSTFAALKGTLPAGAAMWLPGAFILLSGLYMLRQKNRERPIFLVSWTEETLYYVSDLVREYRERRKKRK